MFRNPVRASSSSHGEVAINSGTFSSHYPFRLNFYNRPPAEDVTLEDFEEFAIARLRIIALIETSLIRALPQAQLKTSFEQASKRYLPLSSRTAKAADLAQERKQDEVGHFVLRLAFCGSEELRERFVRAETALFKLRWETDDVKERKDFQASLNLGFEQATETEKEFYKTQLFAVHSNGSNTYNPQHDTFYKVAWQRVPDLVGSRRVFVVGGFAFVSEKDQLSLVLREFESRLMKGLQMTAKYLPRLDEDTRLLPILSHLSLSYLSGASASDYTFSASDGENKVTAEMVDGLAKKHFPPCARHLWEEGKAKNHLKHYARLQFGLFLKGIGLSIDEALLYWRKLFAVGQKMSEDKFKKEHVYNIRHSFGLEGAKKNYTPKSCQQILTQNQPGAQDTHGCPFRHFAPDRLSLFLSTNYSLTGPDLAEVMGQVSKTHYHVACTRVFECTHSSGVKKGEGLGGGENVDHPNKWFDRSWELEQVGKEVKDEGAGDQPMKVEG